MKRLIALLLLLPLSASSQTIQSGGGGAVVGSSPVVGGPTGCLLFNNGGIAGCDSGLTYSGAGNPVTVTSANSAMTITANTKPIAQFNGQNNGQIIMQNQGSLAFSSAGNFTGADTGISRHTTAGVLDIGNGTNQNTAGGIQTGNATLLSLTTGTNADFLCLNAGGGILIQTTACTISSLRFKPDWKPYQDNAVAKIVKLEVGTFHLQTGPNADPNAQSLQAGLSAESVAAIAPECAVYENDMKTPKSYRQECVIALLVKAIQQLKK